MKQQEIKQLIEGLNFSEVERLKAEGYLNECFFNASGTLTEAYTWEAKEKKKYIYLDVGGSGAFMIEIETGLIFGIKGYGSPNKLKCYGSVFDMLDLFKFGKFLHSKRFDYRR